MKVTYVKAFKMSGGEDPDLTVGKTYELEVTELGHEFIRDDKGNMHFFTFSEPDCDFDAREFFDVR